MRVCGAQCCFGTSWFHVLSMPLCFHQVDGLCDLAQAWLWPKAALSEAHEERERTARHFSEARQAYLEKVEEALDFLRRQGVSGTAKYAVTAVMGRLDEAQHISLDSEAEMVVQRVSDAWASLASLPPSEWLCVPKECL